MGVFCEGVGLWVRFSQGDERDGGVSRRGRAKGRRGELVLGGSLTPFRHDCLSQLSVKRQRVPSTMSQPCHVCVVTNTVLTLASIPPPPPPLPPSASCCRPCASTASRQGGRFVRPGAFCGGAGPPGRVQAGGLFDGVGQVRGMRGEGEKGFFWVPVFCLSRCSTQNEKKKKKTAQ